MTDRMGTGAEANKTSSKAPAGIEGDELTTQCKLAWILDIYIYSSLVCISCLLNADIYYSWDDLMMSSR